jgi:acetyl-CoA synthetase
MGKENTAFDYEKERAKFTWDIPEDYNFIDTIRKWATDRTKLMAITEHPDGKIEKAAYWEVWDNAMRLGNILRESGIRQRSGAQRGWALGARHRAAFRPILSGSSSDIDSSA